MAAPEARQLDYDTMDEEMRRLQAVIRSNLVDGLHRVAQ